MRFSSIGADYSAASSEMKTTILDLVAAEKELLYPLLTRHEAA